MELLEKVSQVAAAAHAPFLTAAQSSLFNLDSFSELGAPRDLAKVFDTTEYAKWKSFRTSEDSRYLALTLPHILMRDPYGKASRPVDEFDYEENVDGTDHNKYLWGNAAWGLLALVSPNRSHATTGAPRFAAWKAAVRSKDSPSTTSRPTTATSP